MDHSPRCEIDTRHIPDSITPLIGVRGWTFGEDRLLHSLSYSGTTWTFATQQAKCENYYQFNYPPYHNAPHEDCSCGIYAGRDLEALAGDLPELHDGIPWDSPVSVIGTVELTGKVLILRRGFRAERAKIHSFTEIRIDAEYAQDPIAFIQRQVQRVFDAYPTIPVSPVLAIQAAFPPREPDRHFLYTPPKDTTIKRRIDLGLLQGEVVEQGEKWIWRRNFMGSTRIPGSGFELWTVENGEEHYTDLLQSCLNRWMQLQEVPLFGIPEDPPWWEEFIFEPKHCWQLDGGLYKWNYGWRSWPRANRYNDCDQNEQGGHNVQFWGVAWSMPDRDSGIGDCTVDSAYRDACWPASTATDVDEDGYGGYR